MVGGLYLLPSFYSSVVLMVTSLTFNEKDARSNRVGGTLPLGETVKAHACEACYMGANPMR